jgi:predicted  nucleic acid-binding Zn-ribbon protein
MKTPSRLLLATLAAAAVTSACGRHQIPAPSSVKTISTDLPDTGTLGPIKMYWVESGRLFRGTCADNVVVIKPNCLNGIEVMDYSTFMTRLDGGLAATVAKLSAEVDGIDATMAIVESDITAVRAAIDTKEQELGTTRVDLEATRLEITKVESFIHEYRFQLRAIAKHLSTMQDADLAQQSTEMAAELQTLITKIADLYKQVPALVAQIKEIKGEIVELSSQLDQLYNRLTNLTFDYDRASRALQDACDDYASYQLTLTMLTDPDGINFQVHAEDLKFQKVRQFVKRFEAIFAAL